MTERNQDHMNRRAFIACASASTALGLAYTTGLTVFNRTATIAQEGGRTVTRLNEGPGDGVAYLDEPEFADGAISLEIRGKNVQQQSFVGVAFHGVDGTTYDAVYFRPFNFEADDPARRVRAVQYVSHPAHPWQKLRAEHPGKYEQAVTPVPDPNAWFRARIVIASPKVSVFVNDSQQPSLVVTQLSSRSKGKIGYWVGNNSSGEFANLRLERS
jgi:hypothetical protein